MTASNKMLYFSLQAPITQSTKSMLRRVLVVGFLRVCPDGRCLVGFFIRKKALPLGRRWRRRCPMPWWRLEAEFATAEKAEKLRKANPRGFPQRSVPFSTRKRPVTRPGSFDVSVESKPCGWILRAQKKSHQGLLHSSCGRLRFTRCPSLWRMLRSTWCGKCPRGHGDARDQSWQNQLQPCRWGGEGAPCGTSFIFLDKIAVDQLKVFHKVKRDHVSPPST